MALVEDVVTAFDRHQGCDQDFGVLVLGEGSQVATTYGGGAGEVAGGCFQLQQYHISSNLLSF